MNLPYQDKLNQKDIWCIAQNKPSLVAEDFESLGIDKNITYSILLARGIFKWLACRRDIIRLKDDIKTEVKQSLSCITYLKQQIKNTGKQQYHYDLHYMRGYLKAKEEDRYRIRRICHSERFRCPDFDKNANEFLESINET